MIVNFCKVSDGRVVETWDDGGTGKTPADVFYGELGNGFTPCPSDVLPGWLYANGEFSEPVIVENVEED